MVRLYYESPQMLLAAETRNIAASGKRAAADAAGRARADEGSGDAGRRSGSSPPTRSCAAPTSCRAAPSIVDLGGATLTQGWGTGSHQELMAVHSLVADRHRELRRRAGGCGS